VLKTLCFNWFGGCCVWVAKDHPKKAVKINCFLGHMCCSGLGGFWNFVVSNASKINAFLIKMPRGRLSEPRNGSLIFDYVLTEGPKRRKPQDMLQTR